MTAPYDTHNVDAYFDRFNDFFHFFSDVTTKYLNHYSTISLMEQLAVGAYANQRTFHQAIQQSIETTGETLPA
ncbi:hypothetical protein ACX12E_18880 [Paenibacillus vandeheii]